MNKKKVLPKGKENRIKNGNVKKNTNTSAKQNAVGSQGKSWKRSRVGSVVLVIFLTIILCVGSGLIAYFTINKAGADRAEKFSVQIGDKVYTEDVNDIFLLPDTKIKVNLLASTDDYSVTVIAKKCKNDFAVTIGEEKCLWNELSGKSFTSGFQISKGKNEFTVKYENFQKIIEAVYKFPVAIETEKAETGDTFEMIIESSQQKLIIGFDVKKAEPVVDPKPDTDYKITLDPEKIYF